MMNQRNKNIRTFFHSCQVNTVRKWCIKNPVGYNKKQGQENEHMETKMSKAQNLFVTERVSSLSMKIWIIKEASFAEAQSIK